MTDIDKNEGLAALRWSCRRGMLELDLILRQFLETEYRHLTPPEQGLFKALLTRVDTELFAWLFGNPVEAEASFLPLLKKIQAYARTGTSSQAL